MQNIHLWDEVIGQHERAALLRLEDEKSNEKQIRGLLPIKTKTGVKQRVEEVEEDEEKEQDEEELGEDEEDVEEGDEFDEALMKGSSVSVVELYAKRKQMIAEKKVTIGSLASNFLENPEERIINLEKLVKILGAEDHPKSVDLTINKLAAASILELLKHVTPGYRIKQQDLEEGPKLKKETLRLVRYESSLLKCYKNYLVKLEKLVNRIKGRDKLDKATGLQVRVNILQRRRSKNRRYEKKIAVRMLKFVNSSSFSYFLLRTSYFPCGFPAKYSALIFRQPTISAACVSCWWPIPTSTLPRTSSTQSCPS